MRFPNAPPRMRPRPQGAGPRCGWKWRYASTPPMANRVATMSRGFPHFGSRLDKNPNATPVFRTWTKGKKLTKTALASWRAKRVTIQALEHWSAIMIPAAAGAGRANLRRTDKAVVQARIAAAQRPHSAGEEGTVPTSAV